MPICHAVEGNRLRLDGGAMFGNVPRALWERWCAPDSLGRIDLASRCLLVEEPDRRVLLETGVGAFFDPGARERYGVSESSHVLMESLARRGLSPADIDVVVLSHLHFDHAGGLLQAWEEGREPRLAFGEARFVVGARALERSRHPHPRDRASFVPKLVDLLDASGRLVTVDGGTCPLLGPAYSFHESEGHTPGLLHTTVRGASASVVYASDLVPGVPWVHLPITMGYDRFPERLVDEKRDLYEACQQDDTWLFFTHDPEVAAARLGRTSDGRYTTRDARVDFEPGLDLDLPAEVSR